MKVAELIAKLQSFPQDARVSLVIATSPNGAEYTDDIHRLDLCAETGEVEISGGYESEGSPLGLLPPSGSC